MDSVMPTDLREPTVHLTILQTCLSGAVMGFFAYSGSFAAVPILYTITSLIFGSKSYIAIACTAFGQVLAGYLHTHSSRAGMSVSTSIFHGFYIAKVEMRNRRKFNEGRCGAWKRFFCQWRWNAVVLNIMWETFTFFYLIQTAFMMSYYERNSSTENFEFKFILLNGVTRYLAGCASGMSTGLINQLWQRYQAHKRIPQAIFNTDRQTLKLVRKDRRKLLSPCNLENWIKFGVMSPGALFILLSQISNPTSFHLIDLYTKRVITDLLVIHGGWIFLRDSAMLLFKKSENPPNQSSNTVQMPLIEIEQSTTENNITDPVNQV